MLKGKLKMMLNTGHWFEILSTMTEKTTCSFTTSALVMILFRYTHIIYIQLLYTYCIDNLFYAILVLSSIHQIIEYLNKRNQICKRFYFKNIS